MTKTGGAQLASPPTKWRYLKPTRASLVAGTVGVPILTGVLPRLPGGGVQFPEHLFIPSIIAILACIPILCMAIAVHNWIIVPSQMKAWNSKWMCGSCECVFNVPIVETGRGRHPPTFANHDLENDMQRISILNTWKLQHQFKWCLSKETRSRPRWLQAWKTPRTLTRGRFARMRCRRMTFPASIGIKKNSGRASVT